jgi:hypothetical protein
MLSIDLRFCLEGIYFHPVVSFIHAYYLPIRLNFPSNFVLLNSTKVIRNRNTGVYRHGYCMAFEQLQQKRNLSQQDCVQSAASRRL